jgi:protein-arginine kinase
MRATFGNQLAFAEPGKEDSIRYKHPFRVGVDIYIRQKQQDGQNWELMFAGQNIRNVPPSIRQALEREFRIYIRQRVKRNPGVLTFSDFIEMARAVNIS